MDGSTYGVQIVPVTPLYLVGKVGRTRLKCHARRLDDPFHGHYQLKVSGGQRLSRHSKQRTVFVDNMRDDDGPNEKQAIAAAVVADVHFAQTDELLLTALQTAIA